MPTQEDLANEMQNRYRSDLPMVPSRMWKLPIDHRGFPVPWFTPMINGEWDFQHINRGKAMEAHVHKTCWICGTRLGSVKTFVIGPMCAINRVSSEPASHYECARFAARACPFLSRPRMKRAATVPGVSDTNVPGIMIDRNPGVSLVWLTEHTKFIKVEGGHLFKVGTPVRIECYTEGRKSTTDEIITSVAGGFPKLLEFIDGPDDFAELVKRTRIAWTILGLPGKPEQLWADYNPEWMKHENTVS